MYVHGLWQRGAESVLLRRRLARDLDAQTRTFSYPSVAVEANTNASELAKFLSTIRADTLHVIGHSLGGVMVFKAFMESGAAAATWPPGRIVVLGSPLRGSCTARNLARLPFGRSIIGHSVREELLTAHERRWNGSRELGVIAGNSGIGLGRLVGKLPGPSDGTILVEETRIEGTADHLVLPVSHTGMVFSKTVARAAGLFLRRGRFSR